MASATAYSSDVVLALNNGTSQTGAVKTINVKIGGSSQKIDTSAYNTDLAGSRTKAVAIASALAPIFTKTVYAVRETQVNNLNAE